MLITFIGTNIIINTVSTLRQMGVYGAWSSKPQVSLGNPLLGNLLGPYWDIWDPSIENNPLVKTTEIEP